MGMIDWDKPYGEHFGQLHNKAKYTQDGTDYNAEGYEIDADGTVVEVFPVPELSDDTATDGRHNPILEAAGMAQDAPKKFGKAVRASLEAAIVDTVVKIGPGDYTALKKRIGAEEYAKLSGEEKRAQIKAFKADA